MTIAGLLNSDGRRHRLVSRWNWRRYLVHRLCRYLPADDAVLAVDGPALRLASAKFASTLGQAGIRIVHLGGSMSAAVSEIAPLVGRRGRIGIPSNTTKSASISHPT